MRAKLKCFCVQGEAAPTQRKKTGPTWTRQRVIFSVQAGMSRRHANQRTLGGGKEHKSKKKHKLQHSLSVSFLVNRTSVQLEPRREFPFQVTNQQTPWTLESGRPPPCLPATLSVFSLAVMKTVSSRLCRNQRGLSGRPLREDARCAESRRRLPFVTRRRRTSRTMLFKLPHCRDKTRDFFCPIW